MKRLAFSSVITLSDDSVTMDDLKRCLQHLGSAYFTFESEVVVVDTTALHLPRVEWIYISNDDSEPYLKVAGPQELQGQELSGDELDFIRENGVCVRFVAEYPRAERYGAPSYSTHDDFAAGIVGQHGFSVPADGLDVEATDRGDDGGEMIWLKIALPAN